MENAFDAEITTEQKAEIIKMLDEYTEKFQHIHEQMVRDQEEIDRLNAESWAFLKQIREFAKCGEAFSTTSSKFSTFVEDLQKLKESSKELPLMCLEKTLC